MDARQPWTPDGSAQRAQKPKEPRVVGLAGTTSENDPAGPWTSSSRGGGFLSHGHGASYRPDEQEDENEPQKKSGLAPHHLYGRGLFLPDVRPHCASILPSL